MKQSVHEFVYNELSKLQYSYLDENIDRHEAMDQQTMILRNAIKSLDLTTETQEQLLEIALHLPIILQL